VPFRADRVRKDMRVVTTETAPRRIVVVGASAGGVEALRTIAAGLPADLAAPLLVVLHVPSHSTSHLPEILTRAGPLPAAHARDGQRLEPGTVLIAPPDCHLMVDDGHVRVVRGPRENLHRPAVDPLFRSAALAYGPGTIGVVLSGTLADGAAGAAAVDRRGGTVVVQDPREAVYPDMPQAAIAADHPDYVLPLDRIAGTIEQLIAEPAKEETPMDADELATENSYSALEQQAIDREEPVGSRGVFGCPECGGVLWEQDDGELLRFRCRVGHAFAADTLFDEQSETLETALWVSLRALEERAALGRRIAGRLRGAGNERSAARYDQTVQEAERNASVIRAVLSGRSDAGP
jgi:two-component system, chemotaxis family, protein-glutamate methylesterase/glutaminase